MSDIIERPPVLTSPTTLNPAAQARGLADAVSGRPTLSWHINRLTGRPEPHWVVLPAH